MQVVLSLADTSRVVLSSESTRVEVNPEMRSRVEDLLGPENVRLITAVGSSGNGNGSRGGRRHAGAAS